MNKQKFVLTFSTYLFQRHDDISDKLLFSQKQKKEKKHVTNPTFLQFIKLPLNTQDNEKQDSQILFLNQKKRKLTKKNSHRILLRNMKAIILNTVVSSRKNMM